MAAAAGGVVGAAPGGAHEVNRIAPEESGGALRHCAGFAGWVSVVGTDWGWRRRWDRRIGTGIGVAGAGVLQRRLFGGGVRVPEDGHRGAHHGGQAPISIQQAWSLRRAWHPARSGGDVKLRNPWAMNQNNVAVAVLGGNPSESAGLEARRTGAAHAAALAVPLARRPGHLAAAVVPSDPGV